MLRCARLISIRGIVQGVGFRPFVYRLAQRYGLTGWVRNDADGVEIFVEGISGAAAGSAGPRTARCEDPLDRFVQALRDEAPSAARIASLEFREAASAGLTSFEIRRSVGAARPTARISPDLAVCEACLRELFDPSDRRYRYPYINCTDCGPRYSIVHALPYDRPATTMAGWPMCAACASEYEDPGNRRFHAQPVACPACGPTYLFAESAAVGRWRTLCGTQLDRSGIARGYDAVVAAAAALRRAQIVAIKGIGGYHLACDARNARAVEMLRERKFRKERPFAVMAADLKTARTLVESDSLFEAHLLSTARPIVLARARTALPGVAPDNRELGVMLPYAPLHHLLFAAAGPPVLVMTSANRSSEPIAYEERDAFAELGQIADAFLIGERPIARRLDDSIVRIVPIPEHDGFDACADQGPRRYGAPLLRRGRGYAPAAVATLPAGRPVLAIGGDLKNALALATDGIVLGSQHIGDLEQHSARRACETTIDDLCTMYGIERTSLLVAHDLHPEYASTALAHGLGAETVGIQHHRAHVASVLAERSAHATQSIGIAFDGTGYGDDGTIWGGEIFRGSIANGFERVAHLRPALLPGGDAAARFPVQAAAGFLAQLDSSPYQPQGFTQAPFWFGDRYEGARTLLLANLRCFTTTSVGRLFDTVAALLGFTREQTFEGQASMWLEHLASTARCEENGYPFPYRDGELDFRPLLSAIVADRLAGRETASIAAAFHVAIADAVIAVSAGDWDATPVVCSGGVFQNALLLHLLRERLGSRLWTNAVVPPNDGGLALGQAALAAAGTSRSGGCGAP